MNFHREIRNSAVAQILFCLQLLFPCLFLLIGCGCAPVGGREYQQRQQADRGDSELDDSELDDSTRDDDQGGSPDDSADGGTADDSGELPPGKRRQPAPGETTHAAAARAFLADVGSSYAENFEQIAGEIEAGKFQSWDEVFELWAERNRLDRENAWKTHMQGLIFDAAGGEGAPMTAETTRAVAKLAREAAVGLRAGRSADPKPVPKPAPRNAPPDRPKTDRRRRL